MKRKVLVVGPGYVGGPLAMALSAGGHDVSVMARRPPEWLEGHGGTIRFVAGDVTDASSLAGLVPEYEWAVNSVSSSRGGMAEYEAVFVKGNQNLAAWLGAGPLRKFVYTSSTSVYAQLDGGWVDESSPAVSESENGRILLHAEAVLRHASQVEGFPAIILRVAGIYGPGRGHLFRKFLRGEAIVEDGGHRWLNMVHRDDVVAAILSVLEHGVPGATYNVADDEPVEQGAFLSWLAAELGRPGAAQATGGTRLPRKRAATSKRVSNRALRDATGWRPLFPSYREGYAAEVRAALTANATAAVTSTTTRAESSLPGLRES